MLLFTRLTVIHPFQSHSDSQGRYAFAYTAAGEYYIDAHTTALELRSPVSLTLAGSEDKNLDLNLIASTVQSQITVTATSSPQAQQRGMFEVSDAYGWLAG